MRRGDYATGLDSLRTELEIESPSPVDEVQSLINLSERACYVLSALEGPVRPTTLVKLNGDELEVPTA